MDQVPDFDHQFVQLGVLNDQLAQASTVGHAHVDIGGSISFGPGIGEFHILQRGPDACGKALYPVEVGLRQAIQ